MVLLPPTVRATVVQYFGDDGRQWLHRLPDEVARRCDAWGLTVTGEAFSGGTHSYVAPVVRTDGSGAVLKIPVVDEENAAEPTALFCYDGDGAIRLYDYDPASGAMLLEHAVPGTPLVRQDTSGGPHREGLPEHADRVRLACERYRRLWREVGTWPDGYPEPLRADRFLAHWRTELPTWERALDDVSGSAGPLGRVGEMLELLARPDGPVGIANSDTHLGNIVAGEREPWLLIDPKPVLAERAFDGGFLAGIQLESRPEPAFAVETVVRTSDWLGVAPGRVRAWALLRAVENAVWAVKDGHPSSSAAYIAVAAALADRSVCFETTADPRRRDEVRD